MVSPQRIGRKHRRSQAGTSVVEMTIVLPVLLLLVFSIGDFGIAFTRWNSLTNATREGARMGVVFQNACDATTADANIQATVADFAASSGLDGASIVTTVTNPCGGTGTQLTVRATVPYNYIGIGAIAGLAPTINLTAQTVMRNE
jgi:Flp pilus assembly protein TadG